jgi:hypothetical protein
MRISFRRHPHDALRRRPSRVRAWVLVLSASAVTMALSGCATTKAATVAEGPPLAVSQAPPRVLVPPEEEPLASTGNGPDTPVVTSSPRVQPSPPQQRRPTPQRTGESEPRAETPTAPTAISPTVPAEATRELRAVPSAADPAIGADSVRSNLDKARTLLRSVEPGKLSTEAKRNYDEAVQLLKKGEDKLKEGNVSTAALAADKAFKLAAALADR